MYFFIAALVFLNMATRTKHRILRYESYFFIFCIFMFFLRKHRKNDSKIQRAICVPKITHKWRPGTHSGSKIVPNSRERGQKSPKLPELPESPHDPPREILQERSSARKAPGNALPREKRVRAPPKHHPVIILLIIITILITGGLPPLLL